MSKSHAHHRIAKKMDEYFHQDGRKRCILELKSEMINEKMKKGGSDG